MGDYRKSVFIRLLFFLGKCYLYPPRTGHWRSAVFLKRIRKRTDNNCWFCKRPKMTRSHVLLHCANARLRPPEKRRGKTKTRVASASSCPTPGGNGACLDTLNCLEWEGWWKMGQTRIRCEPRGWIRGSRGKRNREWRHRERASASRI